MKTTEEVLIGLARRLDDRATDINCGHAHKDEDSVVRHTTRLVFRELAEMLREEARAAKKE